MGLHKNLAIFAIVEAIFNITISLYLIDSFGLLGIAIGTLISHLMTNGWYSIYLFQKSTVATSKIPEILYS
jgi:peptidoglycan biosynthesis protein MviN/MurJ (putative lipid II flippase)